MLRSYHVQKKLNKESIYDVSLPLLASMLLIQMHLFIHICVFVCVCIYIYIYSCLGGGWGRGHIIWLSVIAFKTGLMGTMSNVIKDLSVFLLSPLVLRRSGTIHSLTHVIYGPPKENLDCPRNQIVLNCSHP